MITFSIISCTYNASAVIERTLNSVLNQSYPNIEHIIVDGCSSDDTIAKAKSYEAESMAKHHARVINIRCEKDKGLYDAMNKGIQRATGDYVIFLNAGDIFKSDDILSKVSSQIDESTILPGVVYGNTDIVDEAGHFLRERRLSPPEHLSWHSFKHGMLVCHQSFYALSSIAKNTPYDLSYRFSADVDWCIRIMKKTESEKRILHNTHLTLCSYLDGGMSVQNHRASLNERFHIMRKHYGLISTIMMHLWFIVRAILKK